MYMRGLDSGTNPDIAVIIPSTGRSEQCARLVERIYFTTRTPVKIVVSIEPGEVSTYARALSSSADIQHQRHLAYGDRASTGLVWDQGDGSAPASHVAAVNRAAGGILAAGCPNDTNGDGDCWQCARRPEAHDPRMIVKLDDDHWPVTVGWDQLYLNALDTLGGTGVVYGNDLFQRDRLPTAPGLSTDIVRELGWYAPPQLQHWYCDNFWLELGTRSRRISYLPDVIIEHRNVQAGKAPDDATYQAGGLNAARIDADEKVWHKIIEPTTTDIDGIQAGVGVLRWPSQMDQWASKVAGLAGRKGWKP